MPREREQPSHLLTLAQRISIMLSDHANADGGAHITEIEGGSAWPLTQ